jgi:hypothetical protein
MVYRTSYPWYFEPHTHCILSPLLMVYQNPIQVKLTQYHGILSPIYMVYRTTNAWYIEPLTMVFWPPYTWYFDPQPMVYLTP